MFSNTPVWLFIVVAWVCALAPFFTETPFVFMPWRQDREPQRTGVLAVRALLQWVLIIGAAYVLGNSLNKLYQVGALIALVVLFSLPAFFTRRYIPVKTFAHRLFELLMFYLAVGGLGFAIESYYMNAYHQGWQFYVVTLCLFIVLAYPGFVVRHLLKNKFNRKLIARTQVGE